MIDGEKMRKPSNLIIAIVGTFAVLGMLGLIPQGAAYASDYAELGRLDLTPAAQEGASNASQVRPSRNVVDARYLAYYEESHIRSIKRIGGGQTGEPDSRRKAPQVIPSRNAFTVIIRGRTSWQRLSVLDSPCLTRIDQLPLDNRPPPAYF